MRMQRTSSWLLASLFALVVTSPVLWGQVATDTPVVAAARDGDLRAVRAALAQGSKVNDPAKDGSTALSCAAYHCNIEMPRALLAASKSGNIQAVKMLLEAGAEPNALTAFQQETALMWAAAEGHDAVIQALLDAKADANTKARVTTLQERKHADHPTGGLTALMYAVRNGHEAAAKTLIKGGADPKATNADGVTALAVAVVNDRFDLAATLIELGADVNDGSLYFAVDMHDATTDMRARDGSRLRADNVNKIDALQLIKLMLDKGADPNKNFAGQLHSTSLCCGEEVNASPFFRAAVASDVEALKLMIARGAQLELSPVEVKKEGARGGGRGNANVGRTPLMVTLTGGRGAALAAGPGFERLGAPPFREASNRDPLDAVKVMLAAGADPNAKAPDGATPLHMAVTARQVPIIKELVAAGAKLDAVNRDNQTPLLLAEKPAPPVPAGNNNDPNRYRPKQNTREEVIAALREAMGLGPNDPAPQPPPLPESEKIKKPAPPAEDEAA